MSDDPNRPIFLTSARDEMEAAALAAALDDRGIAVETDGGLTAGFKAEASGIVRILVRQCDVERARAALAEIRASIKPHLESEDE